MKKSLTLYLLFAVLFLTGETLSAQSTPEKPKLIVLIAIDGMRGDLLERYERAWQHGFKRLMKEGACFKNARVDHAITVSHAGHVTLATGQHPSNHGIVDAAYYVPSGNSRVIKDAFADSTQSLTGIPGSRSVSPIQVLSTGLAEWVVEADKEARTLAVGTGNISPVLYSFRKNADVYWYNSEAGRYVTSTYYKKEYPEWVKRFNDNKLIDQFYASENWECSVPQGLRGLAYPDSTVFENVGTTFTFPYRADRYLKGRKADTAFLKHWIGFTPTLDLATLELAKAGVNAMQLGRRGATDFMAIVCSQVDNCSHLFGPFSLEVFDVLLQLDKGLGELFGLLDQQLGANNYLVALSADHGFPDIPELVRAGGKPAERLTAASIEAVMKQVDSIAIRQKTEREVTGSLSQFLQKQPFVAATYTPAQLSDKSKSKDPFLRLYRNSWRSDRTPRLPYFSLNSFESRIGQAGIMLRLKENTMIDLDVVIHGSPYEYDRHVPLLMMGGNIKHRVFEKAVETVDVAPTLAKLAGIVYPRMVDGEVIL